jgi:hypothetical protein
LFLIDIYFGSTRVVAGFTVSVGSTLWAAVRVNNSVVHTTLQDLQSNASYTFRVSAATSVGCGFAKSSNAVTVL